MSDLDDGFRELQAEYLAEVPQRLAELQEGLARLRGGEADAQGLLRTKLHQLAGSGGSYGFPEISTVAREAEQFIRGEPSWTAENLERLDIALERLKVVVAAATGSSAEEERSQRLIDFGYRAHLVGRAGAYRDGVAELLTTAGFLVTSDRGSAEEVSQVKDLSLSEWPDVVVIVEEGNEVDPHMIATAWSVPRAVRPRGIVLITEREDQDRLRAFAAGVDVIYSPEQARAELAKYAKTVARIGSPPPRVLLVEDDLDQAQLIASWLEAAHMQVIHAPTAAAAEQILDRRETLDLVLLDVTLPDADGFSLARLIRQDQRHHLLPVVFLTEGSEVTSHLEALRAGADDFLTKPIEQNQSLLLQVVTTRSERGRRVGEMAYRDGLTGLLNHATFMFQLEHAVEFARRSEESLAFLVLDIDRFSLVNDRHGYLVGDRALLHVTKVFQRIARGSDLIGRLSGEEFGMILRQGTCEGAGVLARKLQTAVEEDPPELGTAEPIRLEVSIGIACYPASGVSAAALTEAATRALVRAQSGGRDRVRFADPIAP
ncbi:MAG: diguanylate cyclase [Gemmatimonadales bacterium]|nr:diguanylate cyclase [Gemmatimonadales bacterium]